MNSKESAAGRYVDLILSHRGKFTVLLLALVAVAATGLPGLYLQADYRSLFKEGNENLRQFTAIEDEFSKSDNVMFVVADEGGLFNRGALTALRELTDRAWKLPYAKRVDSLANYQHTTVEGDDLQVGDFVQEPGSLSDIEIARLRRISHEQIEVDGRLISRDEQLAAVNVTLALPYESAHRETFELMTVAREVRVEFAERYPDLRFELVGMAAFNHALLESSEKDGAVTMPAMLGLIALLLIACLKSVRATVLTLGVAIVSALVAMGVAGWMTVGITPPTGLTPNIVLIVAVANCVHLLVSFLRASATGLGKREAVRHSMIKNAGPILLTNISTAIGFLSMGFSESPPFADLGVLVAIGLVATAAMTLVAVPILLSVLPARRRAARPVASRSGWHRYAESVTRYPRSAGVLAAVIGLGCGALAMTNELDDNIIQYLSPGNGFRQAAELADEHIGGTYSIEMSLDTGRAQGATSPQFLSKLDALAGWLRQQPEVTSVNAISDTVKRLNQTLNGDDETYYKIPATQELAAQYLLLYEFSLPLGLELTDQINMDRSAARVRVAMPSMSTAQMLGVERRIRGWVEREMPETQYVLSSPTIMFAHMGELNTRSSLLGALAAVFLISIVMGVALRSVRMGMISLLPNLMPAAIGFGLWALLFGAIGMSLAMVAGMTLGIVVDDTVHFLSRYLHARRAGAHARGAVISAFDDVGRALVFSTLILTGGFAMLMLGEFRLNTDMGLLTAIIIVVALLFDLVVLPALLVLFDRGPGTHLATVSPEPVEAVARP